VLNSIGTELSSEAFTSMVHARSTMFDRNTLDISEAGVQGQVLAREIISHTEKT
jgi:hypothetical protein